MLYGRVRPALTCYNEHSNRWHFRREKGLSAMKTRTSSTRLAKVWREHDGTIRALSRDGYSIYRVRTGPGAFCTCTAGYYGLRCYHLASAEQSLAMFWPLPPAPAGVASHDVDAERPRAA